MCCAWLAGRRERVRETAKGRNTRVDERFVWAKQSERPSRKDLIERIGPVKDALERWAPRPEYSPHSTALKALHGLYKAYPNHADDQLLTA